MIFIVYEISKIFCPQLCRLPKLELNLQLSETGVVVKFSKEKKNAAQCVITGG